MKISIKIIAAVLAILAPLGIIFAAWLCTPPQYSDTFVGALDEKFERLNSVSEPKIVLVGGSSVAFGLESEILEEYSDMPVVNFGLYAALGTKLMLDLSKSGIKKGDVIILSPELDAQTFSMYFNSETTLQAIDDNPEMLMYVDKSHYFSLFSSLFEHVGEKIKYSNEGAPNPQGVYNGNNFNKYGDIEYQRDKNIMPLYYDPNSPIHLNETILDDEFIDYINEYISYCKNVGAKVYFSYCPMNRMAISGSDDEISQFDKILRKKINCEFIGYIDDYILDPGYFYDTNFHLNDAGSLYRTLKLTEDLLLEMDKPVLVENYPEAPELETGVIKVYEEIQGGEYFVYEKLANGNYMITGLTDKGKLVKELTIPLGVEIRGLDYAAAITIIGEGAFMGCSAEKIIIPENSHIAQINNGAFNGAGSVKQLMIYKFDAETLNPPISFAGTADGFEIHAPVNSDYTTGYFWSQLKNVTVILDLEIGEK